MKLQNNYNPAGILFLSECIHDNPVSNRDSKAIFDKVFVLL